MEKMKEKSHFPIILVIVVVVIVLSAGSYFLNFMAKKRIEKALGGQVKIDSSGKTYSIKTKEGEMTVSQDKNLGWPKNLPINVPEYKSGKIQGYTRTENDIWVITIWETNENDFKAYKQLLISNGWSTIAGMDFMPNLIQMFKEGYQVTANLSGTIVAISVSKMP